MCQRSQDVNCRRLCEAGKREGVRGEGRLFKMSEKNEQTKSHKTQNGHKFEESLNGLAILTDNAAATKISTLNKAEEKQKKSLAPHPWQATASPAAVALHNT